MSLTDAEYSIPSATVSDDSFLVHTNREGHELDDIRTGEANESAGGHSAHFLRRLRGYTKLAMEL